MKINSNLNLNKINFKRGNETNQTSKNSKDNSNELIIGGAAALVSARIAGIAIAKKRKSGKYLKILAEDLSKDLGIKIKTSDLKSVMTKEEFLKISKDLKEENYIASPERKYNKY